MVPAVRASRALHFKGVISLLIYPLNFNMYQFELLHQPGLKTQNPKTPVCCSKKLFKKATYSRKSMYNSQYLFIPLSKRSSKRNTWEPCSNARTRRDQPTLLSTKNRRQTAWRLTTRVLLVLLVTYDNNWRMSPRHPIPPRQLNKRTMRLAKIFS